MQHLWPNLSSLSITPQFPCRSGQVPGGDVGVECGGDGDRSETVAALGNYASVNAINAGGECVGGGRWEWGKKVFPANTSCEGGI